MAGIPQRASKAASGSSQHDFPALFTVEGSGRHEIILVNPGNDLDELKHKIEALAASSPNCAEVLQKYRSKEISETVTEIKVRWAMEGRDARLFPRETVMTEENCEPVIRMMAIGVGKDVFDVKLQQSEEKKEKKEKKEEPKKEKHAPPKIAKK